MQTPDANVTHLLLRWRAGDVTALDALLPLVYEELRELAKRHLRRERSSHTLQRTALVHEAYMRIVDQTQVDWESRRQFFAIASQMMRRVLVDHARRRKAAKRGDAARRVDLEAVLRAEAGDIDSREDVSLPSFDVRVDFAAIDDALRRLESLDPKQGQLVELRFFGGLSIKDTAEVLDISPATVKREWVIARAWLQRELAEGEGV